MEGGSHVSQLELDGLEAAYGLPELLADSRVRLRRVQAEGCSAQAAGPYVDAAPIHCSMMQLSHLLSFQPCGDWTTAYK